MKTREMARGRWDGILTALVGRRVIKRDHGPCPMCGGKDRYRYDNKYNNGDWFCNGCGVGDGFTLIQKTLGVDFKEAAKMVDEIVGTVEEKPFQPKRDTEARRKSLNALWLDSNDRDVMVDYLVGRGISLDVVKAAKDLRGNKKLIWRSVNGAWDDIHYPGMVALIRNAQGVPISIHRTYLGVAKGNKKIMPPIETITGGAVRLGGEPEDVLILAEGIETALAASQLVSGYPAWALLSANNMGTFAGVPKHVNRLIICADHDKSFTGQKAAFALAHRYANATAHGKMKVGVMMPTDRGDDILDTINDHDKTVLTWANWDD